jgi:hypothetical protein
MAVIDIPTTIKIGHSTKSVGKPQRIDTYGIYNYGSYFKNTKWDCIINIILCLRFTNHKGHKPGMLAAG